MRKITTRHRSTIWKVVERLSGMQPNRSKSVKRNAARLGWLDFHS
jgi:hypothetical protein